MVIEVSERVFDPEQALFKEIDFLGVLFFPRDTEGRLAWVASAAIHWLSQGYDRGNRDPVPRLIIRDAYRLKVPPRRMLMEGAARWQRLAPAAEVFLGTLWARENHFSHRNLEHWKAWIASLYGISFKNFTGHFGKFKWSVHIAAALFVVSPTVDEINRSGLDWSEAMANYFRKNPGVNLGDLLWDFVKGKDIYEIDRLLEIVLMGSFFDRWIRTAEYFRRLGMQYKILDQQAWGIGGVDPMEGDIPEPSMEAREWLQEKYPEFKGP